MEVHRDGPQRVRAEAAEIMDFDTTNLLGEIARGMDEDGQRIPSASGATTGRLLPRLVYVVTSPVTARTLMRGHFAFMREAGFDVTLIGSPGDALDEVARKENVSVVAVPMARNISPLKDIVSVLRMIRALRRLRPEIVNAGTPKAGLVGMLAAWATRVPVRIYTLRGLRLETTTGRARRTLVLTEAVASAAAHRIICVSESLYQAYTRGRARLARKCVVLAAGSSNGVDAERFRITRARAAEARRLRLQFGIPHDVPLIGFVGRLARDKGIEDLLRTFEMLTHPRVHLVLVGPFDTGDPLPDEAVQRLRSHPRITVAGRATDPAAWYAAMDLVAFPSYREGFPNVPLEAAAAGLPVVGYRVTGTVDAVVDGETGKLVPVNDHRALASALQAYLDDGKLRRRHGSAGQRRVERHFRPETVWRALAELYHAMQAEADPKLTTIDSASTPCGG